MRVPAKAFVVGLISSVTFALGAAPAVAMPSADGYEVNAAMQAPAVSQTLDTGDAEMDALTLEPVVSVDQLAGTPHNFDVKATIELAESEIGTSRPTGWSQPGECIMSAQRWIRAGGGNWGGGGDPVSNYANATRLPLAAAQPGDIIQYENIEFPTSWVSGVHTLLVTEVHDDGTMTIIESNNPGGSGLVSKEEEWTPKPPAGFQAVVWRF